MKKVLKISYVILALLLAFILVTCLVNLIMTPIEKHHYKRYGEKVSVGGKEMNVLIQGDGDTTVVLMSGYQTAAPALDFKPLIDNLSKDYRVVVAEPFGYGYSDKTTKERTVENITQELHQCLQALGITEYILMPHSIGGIYALYYTNQYPEEVTALIGIDTSVPTQGDFIKLPTRSPAENMITTSGMIRIALALFPHLTVPDSEDPAYTKEINKQIKAMTSWNYANKTVIDEGKRLKENFAAVHNLLLPNNLPVLFFVSDNTIEKYGSWWLTEREKQLSTVKTSKIIHLDGTHYLHWTCSSQMGVEIRDFLDRNLSETKQ